MSQNEGMLVGELRRAGTELTKCAADRIVHLDRLADDLGYDLDAAQDTIRKLRRKIVELTSEVAGLKALGKYPQYQSLSERPGDRL